MASGKTYVGQATSSFNDNEKHSGITKVVVYNGSIEGEYGTDTGDTMRVEFPSVQTNADAVTIATAILGQVSGYQYQPYEAEMAMVEPAAELGDGVSICGDYGGLYTQELNLNNAFRSDISAPKEEEVDNEYPYSSSGDRYIEREVNGVKSTITVQGNKIALVVDSDDNIKAAQIVAAINDGESTVVIDADHIKVADIEISGSQITAGTVTATQIDASDLEVAAANITGTLTASQIDATDLHVSGANIDNLTVTNAQIVSLTAGKITCASQTLGGSTDKLTNLYASAATLNSLSLPTTSTSQLNIELCALGVSQDGGTTHTSWATICSGGSGTAKWG